MPSRKLIALAALGLASAVTLSAQEPVAWGEDLVFHTFSIAAVDRQTGESGVAVTTRNPCVGNGVPWVRAGVGAVATQASTRTAYGVELLDLLAEGVSAEQALEQALADDDRASNRQIGVIGFSGGTAQHTGTETSPWSGHLAGDSYVTQGNLLVSAEVISAVAGSFEASEGSGRHLADRLIAALEAGQRVGGDARKGRTQSAAVIVADPRDGHSRRADQVSTHVNVCEHETPVAELRRVYDTIGQTLGFRELSQFGGRDVLQLEIVLHALGYYRSGEELEADRRTSIYTEELVAAVDAFREAVGLTTPSSGSPAGLVDAATVALMWERLEASGRAVSVREQLREITAITR